jgi:hypothetical protein
MDQPDVKNDEGELSQSKTESEVGERWVKAVNWEGVFWVIILPVIGLVAAAYTPLRTKTAVWALIYHVTTGVGITAGSFTHRMCLELH